MKVMKRMTRMKKKMMERVQTIRVAVPVVRVAVQQSHLQISQTLIHIENWLKGGVYEKEEHQVGWWIMKQGKDYLKKRI